MHIRKLFFVLPIIILIGCFFGIKSIIKFNQKPINFSTQVKPILNKNCIICHGGIKKSGKFSVLFEHEAFEITESGKPAIIKGDSENSSFITRLHEEDLELRMPYEKPPLSKEDIDILTRWVEEGAKWGDHWAYVPPKAIMPPQIEDKQNFIKNEIDFFVLQKLKENNLKHNPKADSITLIRRVSFDITGLPPEHKLFNKWMSGEIEYEALVDTLLTKLTYGEKWTSWWLDLARYADTRGYEKDSGREIWKYRDWVIDAFNQDMPFDKFTIDQLAGDLVPNPTIDQLIATAFHRNTMNNDEGGTDDEEFRTADIMDRTTTTFDVWQSTTMACVQCHSHPYDPIKNKDYYGIYAFFNNSRDENLVTEEPILNIFNENQNKILDTISQWIAKNSSTDLATKYKNFSLFHEPVFQGHNAYNFKKSELIDTKWLSLLDSGSCYLDNITTNGATSMLLKYASYDDVTTITIRKNNPTGEILSKFKTKNTSGMVIHKIPFKKINETINLYIEAKKSVVKDPKFHSLRIVWLAFLADLPKSEGKSAIEKKFMTLLNTPTKTTVPIMSENPDYMKRTTQFFERGNWLSKTDTIAPYTPLVFNKWKKEWPKNRLGLAKWITDKENPLTARTVVNRIWSQIFSHGFVTTLEDLGSQSPPPVHPDLLDWLSVNLMENYQWRLKPLIKTIVMSGTYRQSSKNSAELIRKDPNNSFYARGPRFRLSAEQIRDQALAVSNIISNKMYGPSVMPPQPDGVWQSVYSSSRWIVSKDEDKYRRAVYTYLKRTSPYPSFMTFDAVSREVCTIDRTTTNTPLQALVTLNDPVYLEASYHLAKSEDKEDTDYKKVISAMYKTAMYRFPSIQKLNTLIELYEKSLKEFESNTNKASAFLPFSKNPTPKIAALTVIANTILNLDEFLTKS